jgi:hypothetical protein
MPLRRTRFLTWSNTRLGDLEEANGILQRSRDTLNDMASRMTVHEPEGERRVWGLEFGVWGLQ